MPLAKNISRAADGRPASTASDDAEQASAVAALTILKGDTVTI